MIEWSPHPLKRAGALGAWVFIVSCGVVGLVLTLTDRIPSGSWADAVSGALMVFVLLVALLPGGNRRARGWFLAVLLVLAVSVQLVVSFMWRVPATGLVPSATLAAAGGVLLVLGERRRRNALVVLEAGRLVARARRQGVEHSLPLEAVQEVNVDRGAWSRIWGYADLVALVRKGTMSKHIDRPLVTENASSDPLMGNGWDEEGRFVVKGAHPYKRIKARLENQIRMARLPPREREEAELADRLSEDLEEIRL